MRKTLIINSLGPVFAALLTSSAVCLAAGVPSISPTKETYLRIADEVDANLQKEILQKFFPVTADEKGGGFFENYALNWTRMAGSNKSIVYQGRLTWTSAAAALRFPAQAEMYLSMTRRGAACLADKLWDKTGGGFYWQVDADGKPIDRHASRCTATPSASTPWPPATRPPRTRPPSTWPRRHFNGSRSTPTTTQQGLLREHRRGRQAGLARRRQRGRRGRPARSR